MIAELEFDGFDARREEVDNILRDETEGYDPALVDYVHELNDEYSAD